MKTILSLLIYFMAFPFDSNSQNSSYPVVSMEVITNAIANNTVNGLPDISDSTIFSVEMHIKLFDTTEVNQLVISLGDTVSPGNRLQQNFNWDVTGPFGNGTNFSRNEFDITLNLGSYQGLLNYEAALIVKRTDGSDSESVSFIR